jgi:hypothetical protein
VDERPPTGSTRRLAVYFVHNGYDGWSYGTPMNPQLVTVELAERLMTAAGLTKDDVTDVWRVAQYAEEGEPLYEATGRNRFLVYGDIQDCTCCDPVRTTRPMEVDVLKPHR